MSKKKKIKCHFCTRIPDTSFIYDIHDNIDPKYRSNIPVCRIHFSDLCIIAYTKESKYSVPSYLSAGQKEYVAIKRLEKHYNIISNTIQFK